VHLYKKVVLLEQLSCDNMPQEISFRSPISVNLDKKAVIANTNLVIICLENDCCGEWMTNDLNHQWACLGRQQYHQDKYWDHPGQWLFFLSRPHKIWWLEMNTNMTTTSLIMVGNEHWLWLQCVIVDINCDGGSVLLQERYKNKRKLPPLLKQEVKNRMVLGWH